MKIGPVNPNSFKTAQKYRGLHTKN